MRRIFIFLLGMISFMMEPSFAAEQDSQLVVILLGPPGSGKGTQAVRLAEALSIPHISTGDIFRYNIKNNTALGLRVKEYLDKGALVPDSVTLDMLFDRLQQPDCKKGYLLDGVPRTVQQAEVIQEKLKSSPHRLVVCNLVISDAEVLKRITGRRSCPKCNTIYHVDSKPPKAAGTCDSCQGTLVQRTDDTAEVVSSRLKAYYEQTKPVEEFYKKSAAVHDVDGSQAPDQVFTALLKIIKA